MSWARSGSRWRDGLGPDLVGLAGLAALAAGLLALRPSSDIGFDPGAALEGLLGQLPVTFPAAVLVAAVTGLELATGLVVARGVRRGPFDSLTEAALAAVVVAVLKGTLLVGLLGAFGLFRGPLLIAIDVAVLAGARWLPAIRSIRPILAITDWRARLTVLPSIPLAALVAIVWAGPVLLQLASPVVPFIDVLPNYVGPVEHLRTFGILSPLTATQSPIIGPSRSVLGYDGWLGSVGAMSGLPGVLATSAFILPSTILVALGVQQLATAVAGPGRAVGPWALLAFAVTESFARLGDARGTVLVLPLVCFALALTVERSRAEWPDPWRPSAGLAIGLGLGAAVLVHPVVGAFTIATVAILAVARPDQLADDAAVAGVTAGLIAVPQLAVMLGLPVPPLVLAVWLPAAVAVGLVAGLAAKRRAVSDVLVRLARGARLGIVAIALLGLAAATAAGTLDPERLPAAAGAAWSMVIDSCGVLLVAIVLGWLLRIPAARSTLLVASVGVGLAAVVVTQLLPGDLGFLGDALRFEVPKTVHYWIPVFAAVAAGPVLAGAWRAAGPPWPARAAAVAAIVVLAALPIRPEPIDAYHLGEHRLAESLAIDLRWTGRGFWVGFPDSREIVDPPRREIVDVIRAEIEAGRIRHDTPVLHVARSFQQWVSTPLGVFDGVVETFVSPDREVSHQTVGGRLRGMESLDGLIASGAYPYLVLEPDGLAGGESIRGSIVAAGYRSIFANGQGEVFVR